jgi:hypothetical protein
MVISEFPPCEPRARSSQIKPPSVLLKNVLDKLPAYRVCGLRGFAQIE